AVVQAPEEALYPSMPRHAMEIVAVDHVLPLAGIARLLVALAVEAAAPTENSPATPNNAGKELRYDEMDPQVIQQDPSFGQPSMFSCPDCGGVLWELAEGEMMRFRCRVGHAWTADSLLAEQNETMGSALWKALRAREERASRCEQ